MNNVCKFQIEIFVRRALYTKEDKNYCLLNADLLDYDVSENGTKFLEDHMKSAEASSNYQDILSFVMLKTRVCKEIFSILKVSMCQTSVDQIGARSKQ